MSTQPKVITTITIGNLHQVKNKSAHKWQLYSIKIVFVPCHGVWAMKYPIKAPNWTRFLHLPLMHVQKAEWIFWKCHSHTWRSSFNLWLELSLALCCTQMFLCYTTLNRWKDQPSKVVTQCLQMGTSQIIQH
jgi:hypothetical protein